MKKLAIVIINYNDYKTTNTLINNLKSYKCLEKIVIVDNNSTDDSYLKLKKLENKKITIIKNSKNSYASGLNVGAKYLIKEIGRCNIIFSNADIIIKDEKDLVKLSSDINEKFGVVAPVINEHGVLNRGWKNTSINKEILFNLPLISRYFKRKYLIYEDSYYKDDISIVNAVSGCFFLVDSNLLLEIDYFDEGTFLYYEENILSNKVEKTKKKIIIDNRVEVVHDHSVSIDKSVKQINKYKILKSSQKYFVKNYLKANFFQMFLLFLTNKLSLIILYIRCLLKGGIK